MVDDTAFQTRELQETRGRPSSNERRVVSTSTSEVSETKTFTIHISCLLVGCHIHGCRSVTCQRVTCGYQLMREINGKVSSVCYDSSFNILLRNRFMAFPSYLQLSVRLNLLLLFSLPATLLMMQGCSAYVAFFFPSPYDL